MLRNLAVPPVRRRETCSRSSERRFLIGHLCQGCNLGILIQPTPKLGQILYWFYRNAVVSRARSAPGGGSGTENRHRTPAKASAGLAGGDLHTGLEDQEEQGEKPSEVLGECRDFSKRRKIYAI